MLSKPDQPWKEAGGARAVAFVKQHGGNPVFDAYARYFLLPDGSEMSLEGTRFAPPPTDPVRHLNKRRLYYRLLIQRTQEHLDELAALGRGEKLTVRWRVEIYGAKPGPSIADAHKHLTKLLADQRRALAAVEGELHAIHDLCP